MIRRKVSIILSAYCWIVLFSCLPGAVAELPKSVLYLVGVGPGDPDLITLRALEAIRRADVIYCTDGIEKKFQEQLLGKTVITGYWRLFPYYGQDPSQIPEAERPEAEAISRRREEFIKQVRQAVAEGKTIAILDNGDPLIYGPWAWCLEEFEDLAPIVVPGVSAFNAGNAALRRGVTNATHTKSVILTANDWPGKTDTIEQLAQHQATMVLFTMRAEFGYFIEQLKKRYPPETPVAIVKHAGYADREEVVEATLGTVMQRVSVQELPFEYMIYVGEFLSFRHKSPQSGSTVKPENTPATQR